ncbi:Tyrosine recombinase XerC [Thermoflexales bacterium]|nr:Tyrosine recombinase XerC [Thermoflexales bacterium]
MDRKPRRKSLPLSQALTGFVYYKSATGKSEHTIADYIVTQKKALTYFVADPPLATITRDDWIGFFAWLTHEYVSRPTGPVSRAPKPLAPKTIFNIHTNLSSFYTWAVREDLIDRNLIQTIDRPGYEQPVILPFTKEESILLLKACSTTRTWRSHSATASARYTSDRDQAILLLLLDTGIRAEELCSIVLKDVNLEANSIIIRGKGKGRDKKERTVHFGKLCSKALWHYLLPRLGHPSPYGRGVGGEGDSPLFLSRAVIDNTPMNRKSLYQLLKDIGDRAGIPHVHPHRFRHTFAITYLRNGGDVFTLQMLLGHSDMEMVRRYANIAQADCANAHRKASPVDNWRL